MILGLSHISKSFADVPCLSDVSFHVEQNDRIGIVGHNGAGKSTLFKLITGEIPKDSGDIFLKKELETGYLPQISELTGDLSVYETVLQCKSEIFEIERELHRIEDLLSTADPDTENLLARHEKLLFEYEQKNGYATESEIKAILQGLGFPDSQLQMPVSLLSGGEKTRVALSLLLLKKPELLLLDEPTNHLDLKSITWLEDYLKKYKGAVLLISHDRYFLDEICNRILNIEHHTARLYDGNYTEFSIKKEAVFLSELRAYEKQQDEIRHQKEVIQKLRSFNREKQIKRAESREKKLAKMEILEKPEEEIREMNFHLDPQILSGNDVLDIEGLSKSFDGRLLFSGGELHIKRGEHIVLIGDNGTGKTTFLRLLLGNEEKENGTIRFGANVHTGYYDQEHQNLHPENTVFDEVRENFPKMTNEEIRNALAAFLFVGPAVDLPISHLSGGEMGRVSLLLLMLGKNNFLLLDEPTNHLDMDNREILENALLHYTGTFLSVSHDRYFINTVADRIIELYRGHFLSYIGDYDYYLEKRDGFHAEFDKKFPEEEKKPENDKVKAQLDWEKQKMLKARMRKLEKQKQKLEAEIHETEDKINVLENELLNPAYSTNSKKLTEITKEKEALEETLLSLYDEWMNSESPEN